MKTYMPVIAIVLFVSACSHSIDDARQVLAQQIASQSKGHISLASFTKTDGQEFDAMGVPGYRLKYVAELVFDQSGVWTVGGMKGYMVFELSPGARTGGGAIVELNDSILDSRQVRQGERIAIRGEMTATKSERGWTFAVGEKEIQNN